MARAGCFDNPKIFPSLPTCERAKSGLTVRRLSDLTHNL